MQRDTFSNSGVHSCLLCSNPNLYTPVDCFYESKITSQIISSCITYLPTVLTSELYALTNNEIKNPIFCKICFEKCWILSKLSSQLENLKSKISNHVSIIMTTIQTARTDHLHLPQMRTRSHSTIGKEVVSPDSEKGLDIVEIVNSNLRAYSRFPCKECGKNFSTPQSLNEHIKTTHTEDVRAPRQVNVIDTPKLGSKRKYAKHTPSYNKCMKCGEVFQRHSELIIHDVDMHSKKKEFPCKRCKQWFSSSKQLKRHISEHRHECQLCGKTFEFSVNLEHHYLKHDVQPKIVSVVSYSNVNDGKSDFNTFSNVPTASGEVTTPNFDAEEEYILGTNSCWQQEEKDIKTMETYDSEKRSEIRCEDVIEIKQELDV